MLKLQMNPLVVTDLKGIRGYIAEDNEEYAVKTIHELYSKFENIQMFPGIGADFSKSVSFRTESSLLFCMSHSLFIFLPF